MASVITTFSEGQALGPVFLDQLQSFIRVHKFIKSVGVESPFDSWYLLRWHKCAYHNYELYKWFELPPTPLLNKSDRPAEIVKDWEELDD